MILDKALRKDRYLRTGHNGSKSTEEGIRRQRLQNLRNAVKMRVPLFGRRSAQI